MAKDFPTKTQPGETFTREDMETAYRRGFYQGATAAVEAVKAEYPLRNMRNWLWRLFKWRVRRHRGQKEYPEWLARPDQRQRQPKGRRNDGA